MLFKNLIRIITAFGLTNILLINFSCKKEKEASSFVTNPAPTPIQTPPTYIPPKNTAPKVSAGISFISIVVPTNNTVLNGWASDADNNISAYSWKKLSGPASFNIEYPDSLATPIKNLEMGNYEFELTVTDREGLFAKDTINVYVIPQTLPVSNEIILQRIRWGCPMGCNLRVENFNRYIPANTPYTVFLKNHYNTTWVQLSKGSDYYIYNDGLEILSANDETFTLSDVKIKY